MARICVQCDKKIGLFKTPIEEIYCSYTCRDAARQDIAANERRALERKVEAERAAQAAEVQAAEAAKQARADAAQKSTCPKCGSEWKYSAGAGPGANNHGDCSKCGLSVDFSRIEKCPTCTGMSLIIQADGARCPRCKFRRD